MYNIENFNSLKSDHDGFKAGSSIIGLSSWNQQNLNLWSTFDQLKVIFANENVSFKSLRLFLETIDVSDLTYFKCFIVLKLFSNCFSEAITFDSYIFPVLISLIADVIGHVSAIAGTKQIASDFDIVFSNYLQKLKIDADCSSVKNISSLARFFPSSFVLISGRLFSSKFLFSEFEISFAKFAASQKVFDFDYSFEIDSDSKALLLLSTKLIQKLNNPKILKYWIQKI
ncbi:hypothetical protein GEMRC1_012219 [Eukaryota sp. GEM-RC1]